MFFFSQSHEYVLIIEISLNIIVNQLNI